jgi:carboxyl-terminal processing protease
MTPDAEADWRSFERAFKAVSSDLPRSAAQVAALAVAAIGAMTDDLHDDHTQYTPAGQAPLGAQQPDLGMYVRTVAPPRGLASAVVIDDLDPTGAAAAAGLRPGDVLTAVDGHPVPLPTLTEPASPALDVAARLWTPAQLGWIADRARVLTLRVERPLTGQQFSVALQPRASSYNISARALAGGVGYVRIHGFFTPATGQDAIAALRNLRPTRGVIVDLRGNTGGNPAGLVGLLSAFAHDSVLAINVGRDGQRQLLHTDDSVTLLGQQLVMLVDGGSLSAAEMAAADVRDVHLGRLVGERTAGVVAGAGLPFVLDDGSVLAIDTAAAFGPDGEIVDDIGVPVDRQAPLPTAAQLSAGQDPGISIALGELARGIG